MLRKPHLIPFTPEHASTVVSWVQSSEELERWSGLMELPDDINSVFRRWHEGANTSAYVLRAGHRLIGYGELSREAETKSVELMRVIINPMYRRRGHGLNLIRWLLFVANKMGIRTAYARVHPENHASLYCFRRMRFQHVSDEQRELWNQDQPQDYFWLSRGVARGQNEPPFGLVGTRSGLRYCAAAVDSILATMSSLIVGSNLSMSSQMLQGLSCYAFFLAYFGISESLFGCTPGKWYWSLRVVSVDGSPCRWNQSLIRTLTRLIEVNPLLLGGLPAAVLIWLSKRRQRLGGKWSKTVVVRNEF